MANAWLRTPFTPARRQRLSYYMPKKLRHTNMLSTYAQKNRAEWRKTLVNTSETGVPPRSRLATGIPHFPYQETAWRLSVRNARRFARPYRVRLAARTGRQLI